ncbi:hypothetical protein BJF93_04290 [Xaviernesmea oryzae]|uniref:Uncharacterized protein n=1 Tax=Xaviernesmea oryzae TaxID=464029 RepID=A0A1Q9AUL9_9HYPH|nr:hypothetical protein [Xaviernesmea oryzae]OLP59141.1 hypothetical protein BJF93_04290 [Xaviernesmea oryzae]SEK84865.1 hypothetical protein SAMN04487976_104184 [Xaviernesmea oryzae]
MESQDYVRDWALQRAQQIVLREGMDLALSAQDFDTRRVRQRGKSLVMAIAESLIEASAAPRR